MSAVMMTLDANAQKRIEKLARMHLQGVPVRQCAAVLGLQEPEVVELLNSELFQSVAAAIADEAAEQNALMDSNWDAVEALALGKVVTYLQNDPDPDFALKAAVVANKSVRRSHSANGPLQAQDAGARTIINLNATFVQKLQQNFTPRVRDYGAGAIEGHPRPIRDENRLQAESVRDVLGVQLQNTNRSLQDMIEDEMSNFDFAPA